MHLTSRVPAQVDSAGSLEVKMSLQGMHETISFGEIISLLLRRQTEMWTKLENSVCLESKEHLNLIPDIDLTRESMQLSQFKVFHCSRHIIYVCPSAVVSRRNWAKLASPGVI